MTLGQIAHGTRPVCQGDRGVRGRPLGLAQVGRRPGPRRRTPTGSRAPAPREGRRRRRRPTPRSRRRSGPIRPRSRPDRTAGSADADPGLIGNACDLADDRPGDRQARRGLKLLDPIAKARTGRRTSPTFTAAHARPGLASGRTSPPSKVDLAMADMNTLEQVRRRRGEPDAALFRAGQAPRKARWSASRQEGRQRRLSTGPRQAYQKFLAALAASKSGQTYESLQWAGDEPPEARRGARRRPASSTRS